MVDWITNFIGTIGYPGIALLMFLEIPVPLIQSEIVMTFSGFAADDGALCFDTLIKGDTVREVLDYVEFDADTLLGKMRTAVEAAQRAGRLDHEGAGRLLRFYEEGLDGYTYLEG
jgi:arginine decarboxylase-like protein